VRAADPLEPGRARGGGEEEREKKVAVSGLSRVSLLCRVKSAFETRTKIVDSFCTAGFGGRKFSSD